MAAVTEEDAKKEAGELLDKLELTDRHEPKVWDLSYAGHRVNLIQRPLTFMSKMELFSLLSETIEKALDSSGKPFTLENAMELMGGGGEQKLSMEQLGDTEQFMKIILKLGTHSPDFLTKLFIVVLHVPRDDRLWFRELLSDPEAGFTDEQAFTLFETLIDQNAEAIESFFGPRLRSLGVRAKARFKTWGKTEEKEETAEGAEQVGTRSKPSTSSRRRSGSAPTK